MVRNKRNIAVDKMNFAVWTPTNGAFRPAGRISPVYSQQPDRGAQGIQGGFFNKKNKKRS